MMNANGNLATYVKYCAAAATPTDKRDPIPCEHRRRRFLPRVLRSPRGIFSVKFHKRAGRGTNLIAADDDAGFVAVEEEDGRRHGRVAE